MIAIEHSDDDRVADYRSLRARESTEVMWAEGPTVIERLLSSQHRVRSILVTPAALGRLAGSIAASGTDAPVLVAESSVLNAIVGFDLHRGAIAVADRARPAALTDVVRGASRLVLLEGINDAENLGAIARSTWGLGADGLVLDPSCADPYYRRSVRVSMGELLHLPVARSPLDETFAQLETAGFHVWALTPRRSAVSIAEAGAGAGGVPARLAVVVGAEGPGLSAAVLRRHTNVRIPMRAEVDSLNVGHAVAIALALAAVQVAP